MHGDVYSPGKTRPLSIVNTDNRIIANAYRLMMEPIVIKWVSDMQKGFLQGRSMISNVVDIDFEAMRISLNYAHSAIVLFDFACTMHALSHSSHSFLECMFHMLIQSHRRETVYLTHCNVGGPL